MPFYLWQKKLRSVFKGRVFPRSFFARSLLILVCPVICIHIISGNIFQKHWHRLDLLLSENIAQQISFLIAIAEKEGFERARELTNKYPHINMTNSRVLPKDFKIPTVFDGVLSKHLHRPYRIQRTHRWLRIWVQSMDNIYYFQIPTQHLTPRTLALFVWWALGSSVIFLCIAGWVMHSQVRPLYRLLRWSRSFERGEYTYPENLKIEGASEIRQIAHVLQKAIERIRHHFQERNEMLQGISHDLRTPLARMKLHISLLSPNKDTDELMQDVQQMNAMINSYLSFTQQKIEPYTRLSITDLIDPLVHSQHSVIQIQTHIPHDLFCCVQLVALQRCLQNIIDNALRYAHNIIIISAYCTEEKLHISIEDDGPGVETALQQKIFQPFFRQDKARSLSGKQHTGLGLSIARNIAHSHEGSLSVFSSQRLGGALFLLTLPNTMSADS